MSLLTIGYGDITVENIERDFLIDCLLICWGLVTLGVWVEYASQTHLSIRSGRAAKREPTCKCTAWILKFCRTPRQVVTALPFFLCVFFFRVEAFCLPLFLCIVLQNGVLKRFALLGFAWSCFLLRSLVHIRGTCLVLA